jgi:Lon protease-like protein
MNESLADFPMEFDGVVRLFPLPDIVLLPYNVVPLHIFEKRYREMLKDSLANDRLIAMATLLPGYEDQYEGSPPISPYVCVGKVTHHEKTNAGTDNIFLVGLKRAQVDKEIDSHSLFRKAKVTSLEDSNHLDDKTAESMSDQLIAVIEKTVSGMGKLVEQLRSESITALVLADIVAFNLPLGNERKLKLLAESDGSKRIQMLLSYLQELDEQLRAKTFPPHFSAKAL